MIDFGIKDVVDIVLVAMMLYYVYRLMKESRSLNVFIGIIVFVIVWLFVSQIIEMRLLGHAAGSYSDHLGGGHRHLHTVHLYFEHTYAGHSQYRAFFPEVHETDSISFLKLLRTHPVLCYYGKYNKLLN